MMKTAATAVALAAAALCGAPGSALAGRAETPVSRESLRDSERCSALTVQFDRAAAQRAIGEAAKEQASQGAVLCRAGRYGEGADTLEKAVRMIGETPAKP